MLVGETPGTENYVGSNSLLLSSTPEPIGFAKVDKHKSANKVGVCFQQLAVWMKQTARFMAGKKNLASTHENCTKSPKFDPNFATTPPALLLAGLWLAAAPGKEGGRSCIQTANASAGKRKGGREGGEGEVQGKEGV